MRRRSPVRLRQGRPRARRDHDPRGAQGGQAGARRSQGRRLFPLQGRDDGDAQSEGAARGGRQLEGREGPGSARAAAAGRAAPGGAAADPARGVRRHRRRRHGDRHARGDACGRRGSGIRGAHCKPCRRHQGHQIRHRGRDAPGNIREGMMYYVVTGAAGFIGSKIVEALNRHGITDIIAVDNLQQADKVRNLAGCDIADYVDQAEFIAKLDRYEGAVDAVLHQGACSDTMESDGRYMMENNYRYSKILLEWCHEEEVPLLYASSASVYGSGPEFREERHGERPLNVYGYSKFLFDQVVRERLAARTAQIAGLRYFNVYGPNEAHKGRMASVAYHAYRQLLELGRVRLFVGSGGYGNGEQRRDFIHVDDVVEVNLWFLEQRDLSGIFNCGTGRAQTFNQLAAAVINSVQGTQLPVPELVGKGLIEYVPFPPGLADRYQSFTEADLSRLRAAGYSAQFMSVEQGVAAYVQALQQK